MNQEYFAYLYLRPNEIGKIEVCGIIKKLNIFKSILLAFRKKLPRYILYIIVKNIFFNQSFFLNTIIYEVDGKIVHYSILQKRRNQYKNIFSKKNIEIGPSNTLIEFENRKIYSNIINYVLISYKSSQFFAIVRKENQNSSHIFRKFSDNIITLRRNKYILSLYYKV
jgi:hypothetical protein